MEILGNSHSVLNSNTIINFLIIRLKKKLFQKIKSDTLTVVLLKALFFFFDNVRNLSKEETLGLASRQYNL